MSSKDVSAQEYRPKSPDLSSFLGSSAEQAHAGAPQPLPPSVSGYPQDHHHHHRHQPPEHRLQPQHHQLPPDYPPGSAVQPYNYETHAPVAEYPFGGLTNAPHQSAHSPHPLKTEQQVYPPVHHQHPYYSPQPGAVPAPPQTYSSQVHLPPSATPHEAFRQPPFDPVYGESSYSQQTPLGEDYVPTLAGSSLNDYEARSIIPPAPLDNFDNGMASETHKAVPRAAARNLPDPSPVRTKFPTARIKRIMQADEEVGKVAQQTPIAVGKALELFMVQLVLNSADVAKEKGSKRVTAQMLKQVVEEDEQWDFLRDIVSKVEEGKKGKAESDTEDDEPKRKGKGGRRKKVS